MWRAASSDILTERTLFCTKASWSPLDEVRASLPVDVQRTLHGRQEIAAAQARQHRPRGSLEAPCSCWVPYFQRQLFDSPRPIATYTEAPQSPLTARRGSPGDTLLKRQTRVYLDVGRLLGTMFFTGAMVRSPWSRLTSAQESLSHCGHARLPC